jgi:putative spermidine/putrescine transport system substrate-binding protein
MNRRSFLAATLGLTASNILGGCATQNSPRLKVRLLEGSVPAQVLNQFSSYLKQSVGPSDLQRLKLEFTPETQLQTLFSLLQTWVQPPQQARSSLPEWLPMVGDRSRGTADLVLLGNYWLTKAIEQKLISPLQPLNVDSWQRLLQDSQWRALVTRNAQGAPDAAGQVWGIPHRWGTTVIAYREDILQQRGLPFPTDWSDLWRPEFRGHISLLDQPREVIGLTLKKLGHSYNTPNLETVADLPAALDQLRPQVKLYSSDSYLQPLLLGDTWLAVGWSTDVLRMAQRSSMIAASVPRSGTALWAELWVHPTSSNPDLSEGAKEWLNFTWQPRVAEELSLLSRAASPVLLTQSPQAIAPQILQNGVLRPDEATYQKSEFLMPIPTPAIAQYEKLWQRLRMG